MLRLLIPLALAAVVLLAAATAPARQPARKTACAPSERQLASLGCNR